MFSIKNAAWLSVAAMLVAVVVLSRGGTHTSEITHTLQYNSTLGS